LFYNTFVIEETAQLKTVANFFAPREYEYRLLYSKKFIMEGADFVALKATIFAEIFDKMIKGKLYCGRNVLLF